MSKNKKKHYTLKAEKIPIYVGYLVLILSNDVKKLSKKFPRYIDDDENLYANTIRDYYKDWRGFYVILNFKNKYSKITHGVIAHEAYHVTSFLAEAVGMRHDPANDEPMAYLHEWVITQLYKWIDEEGLKVHTDGR